MTDRKQRSSGEQPASAKKPDPGEGGALLRDQQRALHAYQAVARVPSDKRDDYKILIQELGANIRRSGLVGAMAVLQRMDERAALVLEHLASANIPALGKATKESLPGSVRTLPLDDYMLATREMLKVAAWLKRAAQATFGEK